MKTSVSQPISAFVSLALLTALAGCSSLSMPSFWSSGAKPDPTAEALFDEGNRNFKEKRYVRAIDNYSKIRSDHPFSPLMTQVELKIADSYFLNQQYPEAINAFKEFQAMHPTNESMPFVTLRLGQAHFNQFTAVDRDQKNTEIAKGYFETVVTRYPKSPEAAEAREKLVRCIEYLAEHQFNIAHFYFKEEKYPAARDRFEEIVRKYKDTPTAVKSLYFLGESYRREKNSLRAALAYEALIQHYPTTKYAADARTQLAQLEKEKHDPMALLLMRDRRPSGGPAPEIQPDPSLAKLRDLNLVAKTEVVHENPGDEKSFLGRMADKLNPFSSSDNGRREEQKQQSATEMLAKSNAGQKKDDSGGILASLWPFGQKEKAAGSTPAPSNNAKPSGLVGRIDESLQQKGIDSAARQQALKPPAADLPKTEEPATKPASTDTGALLSSVDSKLKRSGKDGSGLPPVPEAAPAFQSGAIAQAASAKPAPNVSQDVQSSGILSSIDQKLKARGVEPGKFEAPPTPEQVKTAAVQNAPQRNVEIEPKVALEKGPLFLNSSEASSPRPVEGTTATSQSRTGVEEAPPPSRLLVKGPMQNPSANRAAETRKPARPPEAEPTGVLDQIRQDVENVGKALTPFSW